MNNYYNHEIGCLLALCTDAQIVEYTKIEYDELSGTWRDWIPAPLSLEDKVKNWNNDRLETWKNEKKWLK